MRKYGVEIVERPKIRPTKELDLSGKDGEKLVRLLTKKILIRHEKTFKRLSEMMQITEDDLNTERLIEASLVLPTVKVSTDDAIADFFEDDDGY